MNCFWKIKPVIRAGLASLVFFLGLSVFGQESASVVRDVQIRNEGPRPVDESFILSHTRIRAGDRLESSAISQDVKSLQDTGRFSQVSVLAEAVENGVRLVYVVHGKALLAGVRVTGALHFREDKIREFLGLKAGDLVDDQTVGIAVQKMLQEYRDDFYPDAEASWTITGDETGEGTAAVHVEVREGGRGRVRKIVISGNDHMPARQLQSLMNQPAFWNPFGWFKRRKVDHEELETGRIRIRDVYRDEGCLDVMVGIPVLERDERGRLVIRVDIEEGVKYRFDEVRISGGRIFPAPELERLLTIRGGKVASAQAIRQTAGYIRDYYGSRGYATTVVRPVLNPDAAEETVDVDFQITEGGLVRVADVLIRGNTRTRDKVIRRELLIYPGDTLNDVKARTSERRLINLGYFSNVHRYTLDTRIPDSKDLVFEVEEKRTGQLMFGAGFSSVDNLVGFIELSQGNFDIRGWPFTGGGQKLKLAAQFGSTRRNYELSFVEPWFMDRKLSLGVDLYQRMVDVKDYEINQFGGSVSLGKALPWSNRLTFRYRLEKTSLGDFADTNRYVYVDNPEEEFFFNRQEDVVVSTLGVTLSHDTRDNPFFPSRGLEAGLFGQISGGYFGFDTDTYRVGANATYYIPLWFHHVLSFNGRYEVVDTYGDSEDVPLSDRLFLGGGRTLRGFRYRDVGPKVFRTIPAGDTGVDTVYTRPVGGSSLALANATYTLPLVSGIRLAAFYDIGNVWSDPYDYDRHELAASAGVGLRFDIPGFPIRIDRGWIIQKDNDLTRKDEWVFWIGY